MNKSWAIPGAYCFFVILLFLYSFTQIDLGLTFSSASFWLPIQKFFQYIGYFQRTLSVGLFIFIISGLIVSYLLVIRYLNNQKSISSNVFKLIFVSLIILTFSYNAFSHDLFNYIFDAKIITYYHENPYERRALDYPKDTMLAFMHWIHRVYPYGPIWLVLTAPLSFIGMQIFLPTFFLFKMLIAAFFLGSAYIVKKITQEINKSDGLSGMVIFVLNPLLIMETLVSGHNDILMMFFALLSFYFVIKKRFVYGILALLISVGIKFATVLLLLIIFYIIWMNVKKKSINWQLIFSISTLLMIVAVVIASYRTNFQPWYFLYPLSFIGLISNYNFIRFPIIVFSILMCFYYVPYLFIGDWNPPIPSLLNMYVYVSMILSFITGIIIFIKSRRLKSRSIE